MLIVKNHYRGPTINRGPTPPTRLIAYNYFIHPKKPAYLYVMISHGMIFEKKMEGLLWLGTFMRRADTVLPQHKHKVEERLSMFNDLLEHDPYVQQQRALGEAKGREEGKAEGLIEGEVQALQRVVVNMVRERFPAHAELAQQKVTRIKKPDALYLLISQLTAAPDEATVLFLISTATA